ncbi:hypothetical protein EDB85DRAFT_2147325 [Lactarius pseudohatsudake]|nr:hypothetical protein EDB85DRAFT_2147325 [Lactarius pseudohatsudake]
MGEIGKQTAPPIHTTPKIAASPCLTQSPPVASLSPVSHCRRWNRELLNIRWTRQNEKQDDTYEVRCKIIAFKPGRNINSDKYVDADIKILGEIELMQPLSTVNVPDLDNTIRIFGCGTVTSVDADPASFLIVAMQYIDGGQSSDNVAVRGCLDNNPKWPDPSERIPQPKSVIGWSGILLKFDSYTPPGRSAITCVIVAIKDITYIFTPD